MKKETVISVLVALIVVSLFFGIVVGIRRRETGKGNEKSCVVTDCRKGKENIMVKYVEHDKASKARRKRMTVVGTLPKGKAKQFISRYENWGIDVYGTYLDGNVDIGICGNCSEKIIALFKGKVEKEVAA